ncbi:hypothetical protein JMA_28760 [Jeotgalibacillus malaysiensis]|uniref:Uncharacterized protein n=1 Tax=Jeotgalibacillus malaysiensis TaxID=1508404 RepID=A0A0B5AUC8_9BACL|nr:hypothetical protein JMA_28760 [Jeotgalibacillus malaysiensis]
MVIGQLISPYYLETTPLKYYKFVKRHIPKKKVPVIDFKEEYNNTN